MTTADGDDTGGSASTGVAPTAGEIAAAETSLETWLVQQAEAGVPETVLVGLLRDYADDVFRDAIDGAAILQLPAIAAAETLYVVRNREQVAGHELQGSPDDVVEGLESYLPVTVVGTEFDDVRAMAGWMDAFPWQVHDVLIIASHEVNGTDAVVTRDPEIAERVPTIWD